MAAVVPIVAAVGVAAVVTYGVVQWVRGAEAGVGIKAPQLPPGGPNVDPNKPTGPNTPNPTAPEVLAEVTGFFDDAAFHETRSGNSLSGVARGVLNKISPGAGDSVSMVRALKQLINSSEWNRRLYGVQEPSVLDAVGGIHVQKAFLPLHEPAIEVMRLGFIPERRVSQGGSPLSNSPRRWGDLWIPAVNHEAVKGRVADPALLMAAPWSDGRKASEPSPQVMAVLRKRVAA